MDNLRMRQVHLDFHTAGQIGDVGADWDAEAFVDTLKRAHVDSITCFARGHHGYVYYLPTRFTPHPSLRVDLLGQQITVCHREGIRVPIYVTVGWDELTAERHPEWQQVTPEGVLGEAGPLAARWKNLCLNTPYVEFVWEQTKEVLDLFGDEVDGFFFDIIHQRDCVCRFCRQGMAKQGLDPLNPEHRAGYHKAVEDGFRERFSQQIRAVRPEATIFYNSGHVGYRLRDTLDTFSHLELESLPSTGMWGYNHFPLSVRYARTLGKPLLGMTGKFHTAWGDFGSFKNLPALQFECFQMLANGAACSIGDQLHPRGRLGRAAYELIGEVYASVEAKEPWCIGAEAQAEIAVFNVEAVGAEEGRVDPSNTGALRMLMEAHHQFDLVDDRADWSGYKVLVLPDKVPLDEALAAKVRGYLESGGKIIASYRSGLTPAGDAMALDEFGLCYLGPAPYVADYVVPRPELGAGLAEDTEFVFYEQGIQLEPLAGTRTLADTWAPYFNRTWDHFCSHRQTPAALGQDAGYPAITSNPSDQVIYFAHPLFDGYRQQAVGWYKQLFLAALAQLLPEPMLVTNAPSTAQATLLRQPLPHSEGSRTIVHLLHYIPERRGLEFDTIEDVIPLHNIELSFRTPTAPGRVYLAPQGDELSFTYEDDRVHVVVPSVIGHQMVVAE